MSVFLREWAIVVRLRYRYVFVRNSITDLVNRNLKLFKSLGAHIVWNSYLFIFLAMRMLGFTMKRGILIIV